MRKRTTEALERLYYGNGALSSGAAEVLLREADDLGELVDEIVKSNASPEMRAHSLCALLGLFGVGTIVKGRIQ